MTITVGRLVAHESAMIAALTCFSDAGARSNYETFLERLLNSWYRGLPGLSRVMKEIAEMACLINWQNPNARGNFEHYVETLLEGCYGFLPGLELKAPDLERILAA